VCVRVRVGCVCVLAMCRRPGGVAHEDDGIGVGVAVGLEVAVLAHEGRALLARGGEHGPHALEEVPHVAGGFLVNMFTGELQNEGVL
jgi:hypothetical protein